MFAQPASIPVGKAAAGEGNKGYVNDEVVNDHLLAKLAQFSGVANPLSPNSAAAAQQPRYEPLGQIQQQQPLQLYESVEDKDAHIQPVVRKLYGDEALRAWMNVSMSREEAAEALRG